MSVSSLSMSMAATSSPSSSSSSLFNNVVSNLSFTIPLPTHQFHPKSKPLRLKTHFPNFYSFSLLSRSHLCRASSLDFLKDSTFTDHYDEEDEEEGTESEEFFDDEVEEDTESLEFFDDEVEEEEEEEEEEEAKKVDKVSDSTGMGRLYVGNLPYSMSSSQLAEVFGEAGHVVSVEVVYDRVTDRSRGFAFVTMGSVEEAKEAIRMFDRSQVGGRSVKVNFPEVPKGGERAVMQPKVRSSYEGFVDSPNKIYAGNLGWSITSESLREIFADQPGVLSAKVVYDRDSGRSRGFGFVSFESAEDAQSALNAMNGEEVEGRALRLNLAKERSNGAPPAVERNTKELDKGELLSSMST